MIHAEWMVAIDIKRLYIHRVMPRECSVIQKPFHFFKRLRLRTFLSAQDVEILSV